MACVFVPSSYSGRKAVTICVGPMDLGLSVTSAATHDEWSPPGLGEVGTRGSLTLLWEHGFYWSLDHSRNEEALVMNVIQDLINHLQAWVGQAPELVQPLVVMLAGAIPAIESDIAAVIGIVGGLNPIVAAVAGIGGNFLTVMLTVLLTSRARSAVVNRRSRVSAGAVESTTPRPDQAVSDADILVAAKPESKSRQKGRQRLNRWFVRFGVPGASLLAPLALPTQVTSAILVAGGSPRAWVLLWQAIAIVLWTAVASVSAWLALTVVFLA